MNQWRIRCKSDLGFFEDGTKLKIPSQITLLLTKKVKSDRREFFNIKQKVEGLVHFFEDGIKFKMPSQKPQEELETYGHSCLNFLISTFLNSLPSIPQEFLRLIQRCR
jgi:hypothetical protein